MEENEHISDNSETTIKPSGKHAPFTGKEGKHFSPDNQPSGKAKSQGKKQAKLLRDLLKVSTAAKFNDNQKQDFRRLAAEYFGLREKEVTVEMMMDYRQIEKAIGKADTNAYNSVKEWVYGSPKQHIETQQLGKDGQPVDPIVPTLVINQLEGLAEISEKED